MAKIPQCIKREKDELVESGVKMTLRTGGGDRTRDLPAVPPLASIRSEALFPLSYAAGTTTPSSRPLPRFVRGHLLEVLGPNFLSTLKHCRVRPVLNPALFVQRLHRMARVHQQDELTEASHARGEVDEAELFQDPQVLAPRGHIALPDARPVLHYRNVTMPLRTRTADTRQIPEDAVRASVPSTSKAPAWQRREWCCST